MTSRRGFFQRVLAGAAVVALPKLPEVAAEPARDWDKVEYALAPPPPEPDLFVNDDYAPNFECSTSCFVTLDTRLWTAAYKR